MNNNGLASKMHARFNRGEFNQRRIVYHHFTNVTASSNRHHGASPLVKAARAFWRAKTSLVSDFIFNFSTEQLVDIYPKHLKGSDFKWVTPEGIKPLNKAVFALPKEQQRNFKINATPVALHRHEKAATLPLPPTHTPVKLHLSAKRECFTDK